MCMFPFPLLLCLVMLYSLLCVVLIFVSLFSLFVNQFFSTLFLIGSSFFVLAFLCILILRWLKVSYCYLYLKCSTNSRLMEWYIFTLIWQKHVHIRTTTPLTPTVSLSRVSRFNCGWLWPASRKFSLCLENNVWS